MKYLRGTQKQPSLLYLSSFRLEKSNLKRALRSELVSECPSVDPQGLCTIAAGQEDVLPWWGCSLFHGLVANEADQELILFLELPRDREEESRKKRTFNYRDLGPRCCSSAIPRHSMGLPYMSISWDGLGG